MVNSNRDRTSISYARYLVSVEAGHILPREFEVDHKNTVCSDDSMENLQVLTREEHLLKTAMENSTGRTVSTAKCGYCGIEFSRETRNFRKDPFCSKSCVARFSREYCGWSGKYKGFRKNRSQELVDKVSEMRKQGLSETLIANNLGVTRHFVVAVRKDYKIP